ncbi:hypothetical protein NQ317_017107 [Molorchus minor]|uniref:Peptidase A2 domain-containing protein n=1 Tax=Molorchus minor TaxID=1323400 RepID=A0ABQ9ITA5_9CUCU|nr:hypothetical protein NQ317_017107 [Molorchus minor]
MARKMKINRLAQDELTYELTIRGIGTGTCEQMRISLSRAIQMEKEGASVKRPPHPYSFEEDVTAITGKLKDAKTGIEAFSEGRTGNQYAKWETKLNHLLGRIEWINVSEGDEEKQRIKSEFLAKIFGLMSELDNKAKQYEIQSLTPAEISLLRLEELSSGDSGDEDRHNETLPGTSRASEKKGMSLNAFLQRVEELRVARHVSRDELFDTAVDLFKGKALIWYRAVRKEVNHWDDLVKLLREEFQPCDYNEKLFEEIKRRTQGSDESIGIYLSIMSAMFSRLTCPVGEDVQLKIIMRNISPFYQTQLGLVDITSITQLRTLGRKLEARREAVEAFSLPSRRSTNALEPDLAYVGMASSSSTVTCDTFSDRTERGKRTTTFLESRGKDVGFKTSTTHFRPVLDFILDQCDGDERPYLRVNVLGRTLMGLLDSGASVTILGQPGWDKVKDLNFRLVEEKLRLESRIKLVKVLIVTGLPHTLILGANFWRLMGIVPDLRHNEWQFSKESQVMEITTDSHLREHTVLSSEEGERLKEIVNRNMSRMGSKLGAQVWYNTTDGSATESKWTMGIDINGLNGPITAFHKRTPVHIGSYGLLLQILAFIPLRTANAETVCRKIEEEPPRKPRGTYNLRRRNEEFDVHQMVWKRNFVLSDASKYFSKKLAPQFVGPFSVKRKLSPWTYELEDKDGRSVGIWNAKNLKSATSVDENLRG